MILLDTQVLLWFVSGDKRLRAPAWKLVANAADAGEAAVSPISFWEVAMLASKGRIQLGMPADAWANTICSSDTGPRIAPLTPAVAAGAGQLVGSIHGDPADRIIIATARAHGSALLTTDEKILTYAKAGHVEAIDARR
jgi:PIN domain nuclease of toxin-antitoxin system